MPRRREPVPRARAAGHWLGGILLLGLLGGAVVAAAMMLWEHLDIRQLAPGIVANPGPLPPSELPVRPGVQPGTFRAVLWRSERNRAFFPDPAYYPAAIHRWGKLVEEAGGVVSETSSLEDLRSLEATDLLVVPEAPCLSRAEASALGAHMDAGGGLVTNWAVGARDEECEWLGWSTVADLTGAGEVRELGMRDALYLMVPAGLPLSPGLDPGTRVELRPEPSLALLRSGPRVYWSDWALNPAPDESGGGADIAAAVNTTPSGGRGAWFGFHLSQAATPRDSTYLERLVKNGILWAAGRTMASVAPWPEGRRSALMLLEDVEAEYSNASAVAELLTELDLPGSFYAVSQLVRDDPELGRTLAAAGEVGSQTSDHASVAGLPFQDQLVRLRRSRTEIREWAGLAPLGLRPPEEAFDANTLRAWLEAGGSYVMAVNQARTASPEVFRFRNGGEPLVLLPRLIKDDYNVFVQDGALRAPRLTEAFLEGTEKLRAIGGLAVIAVHTQIVGTGRRLESIRAVAEQARSQGDWWIARGEEIAGWWAARSEVIISVAEEPEAVSEDPDSAGVGAPAQGGLRLMVQGPEGRNLSGVWVDVVLPKDMEDTTPWVDGVPVSYSRTEWGVRVPLPVLSSGEARIITFAPLPAAGTPSATGTGGAEGGG